ncbi:hypothetical protein AX16_010811 [Volvariella volvacea WC 439]|nr:hypothetical protein AX16_010811 [Volvariella volvacea WC 439]
MANPYQWKFDHVVPGSALFFNNSHNNRALRLEVPAIAMEFTDNVYIGRDPDGFLYYDTLDDFKMTKHDGTPVTHHYKVYTDSAEGKTWAIIEYRRDSDTDAYAKFIAEDPTGAVAAASMNNYSSTGSWVKLILGSSIATVEKGSRDPTITLYADAIKKKAIWNAGSTQFQPKGFTVDGNLYFKDYSKLSNAIYANYNNDRIVFYQDDWTGKDFIAYFIPLESSVETLGIPGETQTFTNVSWVNE